MPLWAFIVFTLSLIVGSLCFLAAHSIVTGWYPGCGRDFWTLEKTEEHDL